MCNCHIVIFFKIELQSLYYLSCIITVWSFILIFFIGIISHSIIFFSHMLNYYSYVFIALVKFFFVFTFLIIFIWYLVHACTFFIIVFNCFRVGYNASTFLLSLCSLSLSYVPISLSSSVPKCWYISFISISSLIKFAS